MSFILDFSKNKATAAFSNIVGENEIKNSFLDIIETVNIKKLNYIVLNFTDIISYTIPKNYMDILKLTTHFSTKWNSEITVVVVATNAEIRIVVENIIEHQNQIKWKYFLFEGMETAKNAFSEI